MSVIERDDSYAELLRSADSEGGSSLSEEELRDREERRKVKRKSSLQTKS